jgi:hypothetical protein
LSGYKKSGKKQYGQRQTKLPGLGILAKSKPPVKTPAIAAPIPTKTPAGYDPKRSIEDQDVTVKAKLIRELLKQKFSGVDFRVKTSRYSMGESIHVYWTDGPALDKVEPLLQKYEDLNTDPSTGEILCGGNSHVFAERSILPETQKKIDASVRAKYGQDLKEWDNTFSIQRWQMSRSTDFSNQPAPKF